MSKPVVRFGGCGSLLPGIHPDTGQQGRYAFLSDIENHPRLGVQKVVTTSPITRISIETENTIYVYENDSGGSHTAREEDDDGEGTSNP